MLSFLIEESFSQIKDSIKNNEIRVVESKSSPIDFNCCEDNGLYFMNFKIYSFRYILTDNKDYKCNQVLKEELRQDTLFIDLFVKDTISNYLDTLDIDSTAQTSSSIDGLNISFKDKVQYDKSLHYIKMYIKIAWRNNKYIPKIYYNRQLIEN